MKICLRSPLENGERFLRPQLDNLLAQKHLPHEAVLSDDGSTDGTLGILEEFTRERPSPNTIAFPGASSQG